VAMRIVRFALLLLAAVLVLGAAALIRLDMPRTALIAKYAGPEARFVTLPDGTVAHVRLAGPRNRPAVVLLHGEMNSLQSWDSWAQRLSENYRVVSIDEPGHGLTGPTVAGDYSRAGMVSFVHAVFGRLNVRRAAIVGHSMGGGVAAEYAERYPDEVWALVLIDASGIPRTGPPSSLEAMAHHAFLRPVLRWTLPRWMIGAGVRNIVGDRSKATDEMIDRIYDLVHFPGNRAGLIDHYLAPNDDSAVEAGLSHLAVPTLIEWGGSDPVLPLSSAREFQRLIRDARLLVYPGVGHLVPEELPEQSEQDAAAFLAQVQPPSGPPQGQSRQE
jgi:pimeloyl-ACP methyl ester carboxylesterase